MTQMGQTQSELRNKLLSRVNSEAIDRLILDIHAAPVDEARWPGVVRNLATMLNADRAMLFSVPTGRCESFWNVVADMDPSFTRDYAIEFAPEDTWALAAKRLPAPIAGRIVHGDELVERRAFLRTRFFNELLARHDVNHFICLLLREPPSKGAPPAAALSFYRGGNAQSFDASAQEILAYLAPHLLIAIETLWKVRALSLRSTALAASLDAVAAAIFVLDATGRVLFENSAAQRVRRGADCITIESGYLKPCIGVREPKLFNDAIQGLLLGRATTVQLTVGLNERTMVLSTAPFTHTGEAVGPWVGAAGIVWIAPSVTTKAAIARIASLFALTAAEERLLDSLTLGCTLQSAAESLQISIHTARNQLKAIQRKTGWRTQGELQRMVQQLSAVSPSTIDP